MRPALVPILLADPLPWAKRAEYAWDFLRDRARFAGGYKGALANTPNWTFTRASTGYAQTSGGVLQSFASGELRRTDKGVLIEGARTNTQTSTNLNPSATTNISLVDTGTGGSIAIVDDSAELAALGLTGNALRIIGGTGIAYANFAGGAATDVVHVCSAYVRGGAGRIVYSSGGALTYTFSASTSYVRRVAPATAPGAAARTMMIGADAGQTLYVTLHVMEAGAFVSSPIPVAGASATRAADVLTVPVSGIDYPLSLFAEWEKNGDDSVNPYQRVIEVGRATTTDQAVFYHRAVNNSSKLYSTSGGVAQADLSVGTSALNTTRKMAGRFATNDFAASLGGAAVVYDTSGSVPATPQNVYFGHQPGGANMLFGYLRRAAIFSRALSDGELQALTT